MKAEELDQLRARLSQTACKNMSEYCRKILLKEPVLVLHRNHSLDQHIHEMIRLRKNLEAVKEAFEQLRIESRWYRARMPRSYLLCLLLEEYALDGQFQHVKKYFQKISAQWLP